MYLLFNDSPKKKKGQSHDSRDLFVSYKRMQEAQKIHSSNPILGSKHPNCLYLDTAWWYRTVLYLVHTVLCTSYTYCSLST